MNVPRIMRWVAVLFVVGVVGTALAIGFTSDSKPLRATPAQDLIVQAEQHFRATTTTYQKWLLNVQHGIYNPPDGSGTEWGMGFAALEAARQAENGTTTASTTTVTTAPSTSAATTTTSPSGQVVFRGDFESCTLDDGKWLVLDELHGYVDDQNYNHGRDYIDRNNPGSGSCALRQDLEADTSRSSRADVVSRPIYTVSLGQDIYYSDEFRLPSNWQVPTGWGFTVGQFVGQYPNIWATPVQTVIYGPQSGQGFNYGGLTLTLQSGKCATGTGCSTSSKYIIIAPQNMTLGVWHQYVIHVRVAQDNTGVVEVWWRNRGETAWNKTVNVTGVPTLQWSNTTPNPILDFIQTFAEGYRGTSPFPISIWHDNFCRATTFTAAESCLG